MANGKNDTLKNVGIGALGVGGALAATRPNQFKALVNNVAYKTGVKDLPDGVTLEGLPSMGDSVTKALDVTGNGDLTDELGIAGAVAAGAYLAKKAYNKHMNNQARIALAHANAVNAKKDMAEGPGFDIKGTVGDITMHNQYEAARRRALKRNDLDAVRRLDADMEALDDITSARQGSSLLGLAGAGIGGVLGGMMTGTPTGALLGAGLGASTGVVSNLSKVKAEADARQRLRRHANEDSWDMSAKDFAKETRGFFGQENAHRIADEDYLTKSKFVDENFGYNPVTNQYIPNDPNQTFDFKPGWGGTATGESQDMTDYVKEFVGGDGLTPNARALENLDPNADIHEGIGVGGAVAGALLGGLALKKIYDAYRPRAKRNASYDKDPVEIMENMPVSAKKLSQQKAGVPMAFSESGDFGILKDLKDAGYSTASALRVLGNQAYGKAKYAVESSKLAESLGNAVNSISNTKDRISGSVDSALTDKYNSFLDKRDAKKSSKYPELDQSGVNKVVDDVMKYGMNKSKGQYRKDYYTLQKNKDLIDKEYRATAIGLAAKKMGRSDSYIDGDKIQKYNRLREGSPTKDKSFSQKVGDFALFDWKDTWDILSDAGSNKLARDITDGAVSLGTTAYLTDKLNLEDPRAIQAASYVGDVAGDVARVGTGAVHGIDTIVEGFKEGDPGVIIPTAIVGTGLGALIAKKAMRKGR